jgi:hypothetical protein
MFKGIAWVLGIALLALAGLFGINATDEELSQLARTALRVPPPPAASERNGYIDFLALRAPADAPTYATGLEQLAAQREQTNGQLGHDLPDLGDDPRVRRCQWVDFIDCVAGSPNVAAVIESHAVLLLRYRAMREQPDFVELSSDATPFAILPAYRPLAYGHRLSLMVAARRFNAGEVADAIKELEAEFGFYRKVAAGSRTMLLKMIAFEYLDSSALFAADLARRMSRRETALWQRLHALLRAPTKAESDVSVELNEGLARTVRWMRTRRFLREPDWVYRSDESLGETRPRAWWDPVAPWLYRPHYSVNRYVAKYRIMQSTIELPSKKFLGALAQYRARAAALEPAGWRRWVLSPATQRLYLLEHYDASDYVGRMYGHAAFQALVALQVRLRAAGITRPAAVQAALRGPLGAAYSSPFAGAPFQLDANRMSLGFECEEKKYLTLTARERTFQNGRVELPL